MFYTTSQPLLLLLLTTLPNESFVSNLAMPVCIEIGTVSTIVTTIELSEITTPRMVLLRNEVEASRMVQPSTTMALGARSAMNVTA